jgi:hypothetical protein
MQDNKIPNTTDYSERQKKVVIARTPHLMRGTKQSPEIASLRPEHHAVQGFARNDSLGYVFLFRTFTIGRRLVMKNFKGSLIFVFFMSSFFFLEMSNSIAQEKFSTFTGKVIGIRMRLWLDVESQTDNTVMNFRIGRRTVYHPHRYPNRGETVKVEYQVHRGVPVAFTVNILEEGAKEVPKGESKEGPTETPTESPKESSK